LPYSTTPPFKRGSRTPSREQHRQRETVQDQHRRAVRRLSQASSLCHLPCTVQYMCLKKNRKDQIEQIKSILYF
jgi:hypothetical protein